MSRRIPFLIFPLLFFVLTPSFAVQPDPISWVNKEASYKQPVLITGIIIRQIDFDFFVLEDSSGNTIIDMRHIRHKLKLGDEIFVYGWFDSEPLDHRRQGQVDVYKWAYKSDMQKVLKLMAVFETATARRKRKGNENRSIPYKPSHADRLKSLDVLKSQGIISEEEYERERRRILSEL